MFKRLFLLVAIATPLVLAAAERSNVDKQIDAVLQSNKIVNLDGKESDEDYRQTLDSIRRVVSTFYYDQFRHSQDPGAPFFLFLSKDAGLTMGIGGLVRMRGYYDWGGAVNGAGFAPMLIPMTPSPTLMRNLGTTPAGTCLYFRVLGRNKILGNYQLYIEANFNGYGARDFHLKKAYAIVRDFTVGYAASTFSDPTAVPPTVDAQGPNNKISPTAVLVRYMPVFKDRWYWAISAETPSTAVDADNSSTAEVNNWLPDFATFFQYQWENGQHVRLAGIIRTLPYRNLMTETNHNKVGWGIQLSSVAHPLPELTSYITLNYGKGHESLGGDVGIGNRDLLPTPGKLGQMYTPGALGWCVGLQYNFKPNLFMSISASEAHYFLRHGSSPDEYKRGLYTALNVFWDITPRFEVAAELNIGRRENYSGEHRYARRIGAMCQFSF